MAVKRIEYDECDCGGKVLPITACQISWGTACGDGGDVTSFFECDSCHKIYYRNRSISGNYISDEPDSLSNFYEYKGNLTKEELITFAPMKHGNLYEWDENKIIASRTILAEAKELWNNLNANTSTDIAGDITKFEAFCYALVNNYFDITKLFKNGTDSWNKRIKNLQDKYELERRNRRR